VKWRLVSAARVLTYLAGYAIKYRRSANNMTAAAIKAAASLAKFKLTPLFHLAQEAKCEFPSYDQLQQLVLTVQDSPEVTRDLYEVVVKGMSPAPYPLAASACPADLGCLF
jgi:hypothetical protein